MYSVVDHVAGNPESNSLRIPATVVSGVTTLDLLNVRFGNLEFSEFLFIQHESRNVDFRAGNQDHKMLRSIAFNVRSTASPKSPPTVCATFALTHKDPHFIFCTHQSKFLSIPLILGKFTMSRRAKSKLSGDPRPPAAPPPIASRNGNPSLPEVQPHPRWQFFAACLFLALAVWAVYGQTLQHDFVNYDDTDYVYENRYVFTGLTPENVSWALTAVHASIWQPLVWLSFMIDYELHGLKAGWFHMTNVLLHIASTLLLLFVLRRMGGGLWRSLFVAALFALHPLHVESVAWVTERKDVLSALFWMLTMWGYLRYVERPGTARYLTTIFFFVLGLMAKPMLMTLPAVLLLLDWWPLGRVDIAALRPAAGGKKEKPEVKKTSCKAQSEKACALAGTLSPARILLEKFPFIVLSLLSCSIAFFAVHQTDAIVSMQNIPLGSRIANALVSYVLYLWKMLWPACLYNPYLYSYSGTMQPWWKTTVACIVLAGLTFAAVKTARKRSYFLFGWLWYLGTLIPVIGFVQVGAQTMADRFTYIPLIGIFIIIAWGAAELSSGWCYRRAVMGSAAGVILSGLLVCAYVQTGYWKDSISLWTHTLACASGNYLAHYNLGHALAGQGKLTDAIEHYESALQLNPDYAEPHNNLGLALAGQGKLAEAIEHYERALQLSPNYAEPHNNLGLALARQGKLAEAIEHYERALHLNPNYAETHNNLGVALVDQGKLPDAIEHHERALQLNPDDATTHDSLGVALARQGMLPEAIEHFERALQLSPDYAKAHYNLGIALARQGKLPEANPHLQQALNLATAQNNITLAESIRTRLKSYKAQQ